MSAATRSLFSTAVTPGAAHACRLTGMDLPYDRFVTAQIAADLLPVAEAEQADGPPLAALVRARVELAITVGASSALTEAIVAVRVDVPASVQRLEMAGVHWHVYSPTGPLGLLWPGQWRRLHRKLCVVDGAIGFCGGINILDDFHDPNHGPLSAPRLDFAVQVSGPLVAHMHEAMVVLWRRVVAMQRLRRAHLRGSLMSLRASGTGAAVPVRPRCWGCRWASAPFPCLPMPRGVRLKM